MGARGTFHPFRRLLRDGTEAFGGLIVPVPTVSVVACGVAGSRTSALTLPLPEGVSSPPPAGEERRPALCSRTESRAPCKGCAPVSAKRPPPQSSSSPPGLPAPAGCSPAPGAPRLGADAPPRPERQKPHPEDKAARQPGQRARGLCGGPRIRPRRF